MNRNQSHELIMQCIYTKLTYININRNVELDIIIKNIFKKDIDDFSKNVIKKTFEHLNEIIPVLESALIGWKWNRISRISQAILLMSYTHFKYIEKIVKAIIIEVAVKLAKKYLDNDEFKFINGVLDKVLI